MGISKREPGQGGVIFADIKGNTGQILVATGEKGADDKPVKEAFDSVSGLITDFDIKETKYGEDTITNLKIRLEESGEKPVVASVALGSFFAAKIVGLFNAADLTKPVELSVGMMKQGDTLSAGKTVDKDTPWVTLRQGGARLVPAYGTPDNKLPDPPEVTVSGKKMRDMTPVNEHVAKLLGGLFAKMDALREQAATPADDHGINPGEAAAAAESAMQNQRSAMAQRA